jgi:hypothetical protein
MDSRQVLTALLAVTLAVGAMAPAAAGATPATPAGQTTGSVAGQTVASLGTVSTAAAERPQFEIVDIDHSPQPVHRGEEITVVATVENRGASGSEFVEFYFDSDHNGRIQGDDLYAVEQTSLDSGERTTVRFRYTPRVKDGNYLLAVHSRGDRERQRVELIPKGTTGSFFSIDDVDAPATVSETGTVSVTATIENTGDHWFGQTLEYRIDANGDGRLTENETVDSAALTLDPFDVESVTLEATPGVDPGEVRHGVFSRDDSWTGTLNVTAGTDDGSDADNGTDNGSDSGSGDDGVSFPGNGSDDGDSDDDVSFPGNDTDDGDDTDSPDDSDGSDGDAGSGVDPGDVTGPTDGSVRLSLVPREAVVANGTTDSFGLVVENATDGIGTYHLTVRSSDTGTLAVTGFESEQDGGISTVEPTGDGKGIVVKVAGVNSDASGTIRLGTVQVQGVAPGVTGLSINPKAVADTTAEPYAVAGRTGALVRVEERASVDPTPTERPTVRLEAVGDDGGNLTAGENRTYRIVASNLTRGLDSFDLDVSTLDSRVAAVTAASVNGGLGAADVADGRIATVRAVGVSANGTRTLGTITVAGGGAGETDLTLPRVELIDESRGSYGSVATAGVTLTVVNETTTGPVGPAPVDGDARPTDPDGDGQYEDVNGDGAFTVLDVGVFLDGFDGAAVQNDAAAFNFDDSTDGRVTITDVAALLDEL